MYILYMLSSVYFKNTRIGVILYARLVVVFLIFATRTQRAKASLIDCLMSQLIASFDWSVVLVVRHRLAHWCAT